MRESSRRLREAVRSQWQRRTLTLGIWSLASGVLLGGVQLVLGIFTPSGWLVINAIYHLVLAAGRGYALRELVAVGRLDDPLAASRRGMDAFRKSGVFLACVGLAYLVVCVWMLLLGDGPRFLGAEMIVYAQVGIAFVRIGTAIANVIGIRGDHRPIASALKALALADACVAIVVSQCSLLTLEASPSAVTSSALFGGGFSLAFIVSGVLMLREGRDVQRMLAGIAIVRRRAMLPGARWRTVRRGTRIRAEDDPQP